MHQDTSFAPLVSLACHDLRTPLATVYGFARTILDREELGDPLARYVGMIAAASAQFGGIVDRLGLAARVVGGRYEPTRREADTLELARSAASQVGEERAGVTGVGGAVVVDVANAEQALCDLALAALRHGGLDRVELTASGPEIAISPVAASVAPVLVGQDLRDLGAAVACLVVGALDGSVEAGADHLVVRLPAAPR